MTELPQKKMTLSAPEARLVRLIRGVLHGEVHIYVRENRPIRVEQVHRDLPLE